MGTRPLTAGHPAFLAAFSAVFLVTTAFADLSPSNKCSAKKVRATGKAFGCLVLGRNKQLQDRSFDPARCSEKLAGQFASAEAKGGCPIVGDRKYGAKTDPAGRIALHACRLEFAHPRTGESLRFESPLPRELGRLLPRRGP